MIVYYAESHLHFIFPVIYKLRYNLFLMGIEYLINEPSLALLFYLFYNKRKIEMGKFLLGLLLTYGYTTLAFQEFINKGVDDYFWPGINFTILALLRFYFSKDLVTCL